MTTELGIETLYTSPEAGRNECCLCAEGRRGEACLHRVLLMLLRKRSSAAVASCHEMRADDRSWDGWVSSKGVKYVKEHIKHHNTLNMYIYIYLTS